MSGGRPEGTVRCARPCAVPKEGRAHEHSCIRLSPAAPARSPLWRHVQRAPAAGPGPVPRGLAPREPSAALQELHHVAGLVEGASVNCHTAAAAASSHSVVQSHYTSTLSPPPSPPPTRRSMATRV